MLLKLQDPCGRKASGSENQYILLSTGSDCCPAAPQTLELSDRRADLEALLDESSRPFTGERSECWTVPGLPVFCYLLGTDTAQG